MLTAPVLVIAAGGGSFVPKRPPIPGIEAYEGTGVFYAVRRIDAVPRKTRGHRGRRRFRARLDGEPAPVAQSLTLVHRRPEFRAAPATVAKMHALEEQGFVKFELGQPAELKGADGKLDAVVVKRPDGALLDIEADALAALLRAHHEARADRQFRPEPQREPDPGRHREIRDLDARRSSPSATSIPIPASSS